MFFSCIQRHLRQRSVDSRRRSTCHHLRHQRRRHRYTSRGVIVVGVVVAAGLLAREILRTSGRVALQRLGQFTQTYDVCFQLGVTLS